jgi:hypothetical protein
MFGLMAVVGYYWRLWPGVWVDATLPVLGIMLHRLWGVIEVSWQRSQAGPRTMLLRDHDQDGGAAERGGSGHGRARRATAGEQGDDL